MVHAPAVGGQASAVATAASSMRNSPVNGAPSSAAPQGRMGRMGGAAPVSNGVAVNGAAMSKPLSAMKAAKLDMATVERRGQPNMARESSKTQRLFGLQEAPTFRPTMDEFRNPIDYIHKIADQGRRYGIVKIIPPDEWNPDLAIDTEVRRTVFLLHIAPGTDRVIAISLSHTSPRAQHRRRRYER